MLSTTDLLRARPFSFDARAHSIARVTLIVDYMQKVNSNETYNTDEMAKDFMQQFPRQALTVGQMV